MISQDHHWVEHALQLAKKAQALNEVPIGAVLTLNNEIIAEGWNQSIINSDPTAHAEIVALRAAAEKLKNYRLIDTTLYVTLEPCVMCAGAILQARIKRVVFGAYDPKGGAFGSVFNIFQAKEINHRVDFIGGVLQHECGELLRQFFQVRR